MKLFFRNMIIQLLYVYSFIMLASVALLVRSLNRKVEFEGNQILYRTDRIGDLIIGSDLVNSEDVLIYRSGTLSCNLEIKIPKFLFAPRYAFHKMTEISELGTKIFVPVAAKTPDALAVPLMFAKKYRLSVSDTGVNFFCAPFLTRKIFSLIHQDFGNEYKNVKEWKKPYDQNVIIFKKSSPNLIVAPYGSSLKKSMTRADIKKLVNVACKSYDHVFMFTDKDHYFVGQELQLSCSNFKSLAGLHRKITDAISFVTDTDADYISVDSAPAHFFARYKSTNETLSVLSSSAVVNRFDIPGAVTTRQHCNYNGCNWICKFNDFRCLNFQGKEFTIKEEKKAR